MTDSERTGKTLLVPEQLRMRLEKMAKERGYINWSEYARALLVKGLEKDEQGPLDRTR